MSRPPEQVSHIRFSPGNHRYFLDKQPIPGVTTLLKGIPKPALVYWSARTVAEYVADNIDSVAAMLEQGGRGPTVAFLKEVPWQQRDAAGARGTDIHALAELLVHGNDVDVPPAIAGHVQGYARWLDEWQPEPIFTERPVYHRSQWYAGTPDYIGVMGGSTWCLDWKTSKGVYGDAACQVAAYINAEHYQADPQQPDLPMPEIERGGVVHITPEGTTLHEVTNLDAAFKDFRHAAWIYRGKDRIDNYLTAAIPTPEPSTSPGEGTAA